MNKNRIFLFVYMALAAFCLAMFWFSPLSGNIAQNRELFVVFFSSPNQAGGNRFLEVSLFSYKPGAKEVKISKLSKKVKFSKDFEVLASSVCAILEKNALENEKVFYAYFNDFSGQPAESLRNFLTLWRSRPHLLTQFFKKAFSLNQKNETNISALDLLALSIELLKVEPVNFVFEDVSPQADFLKTETEEKKTEKIFRIEFVNASGRRGGFEELFEKLKKNDFDIINIRRSAPVKKTEIISPEEDAYAAKKLAEILGLNDVRIRVKKEKYNIYKAVLIAGEDLAERKK